MNGTGRGRRDKTSSACSRLLSSRKVRIIKPVGPEINSQQPGAPSVLATAASNDIKFRNRANKTGPTKKSRSRARQSFSLAPRDRAAMTFFSSGPFNLDRRRWISAVGDESFEIREPKVSRGSTALEGPRIESTTTAKWPTWTSFVSCPWRS